jgi:hypothetical protein
MTAMATTPIMILSIMAPPRTNLHGHFAHYYRPHEDKQARLPGFVSNFVSRGPRREDARRRASLPAWRLIRHAASSVNQPRMRRCPSPRALRSLALITTRRASSANIPPGVHLASADGLP